MFASLERGDYVKDDTFKYRVLGKLSDVIYSPVKIYAYTRCTGSGKSRSCTSYYLRLHTAIIACNTESSKLYRDCQNGTNSLIIRFEYMDDMSSYPRYNCLTSDWECESSCSKFQSYYNQPVLFQQTDDDTVVEAAWRGFCNCANQPNIRLIRDGGIINCRSSGSKITLNLILIMIIVK